MLFRRRPRTDPGASARGEQASPRPAGEAAPADEARRSITGTYLTDGRSLFRVQHAITESEGQHLDEPLLELEDCATLELILCSADSLERLGLRPVSPQEPNREHPSEQHPDRAEKLTSPR